eukprot:Sdes_comp15876_c0_seq1m4977
MLNMRPNLIFFVFFTYLVLHGADALYGKNSVVEELTASNFNKKVLDSPDLWIVEFYAPWCGHCKNLAPEWEKVAKALKGIVRVGAVDMDVHKSLGGSYNIQGFPTIKIFGANKNSPQDYNGGRTAEAIINGALDQAKSLALSRIGANSKSSSGSGNSQGDSIELTESNFEKLVMQSEDLWMVEFFAPWCGHCKNLAPEWAKAAASMKGKVKFGAVDATVHQNLASRYGVRGYPTIKFFGRDKASPEDYQGGRTTSDLVTFASNQLESLAVAPEVVELASAKVMKSSCETATVCFIAFVPHILDSGVKARNNYIASLKNLAEKFKRKPFAWVWVEGGSQLQLEESVEVGGFGYPALAAISPKKEKFTTMKGSFSESSIASFVHRILGGKEPLGSLPKIPKIETTVPWDGKEGKITDEL